MLKLVENRYQQPTPTVIQENGIAISVPVYLAPTKDQLKGLLNAFRTIKNKQLIELGYTPTHQRSIGSLAVETKTEVPKTPIELEMGVDEENLRFQLFGRNGIPERMLLKLCRLTGVYLVTREQIEHTYKLWLDHLYPTDGEQKAKTTSTTRKTTPRRASKKTETDPAS